MPVMNAAVLREAMFKAKDTGLMIVSHCEDAFLVRDYAVNDGAAARTLGIPGVRPSRRTSWSRGISCWRWRRARVHIAHVSTGGRGG
jgi:dihydroorotase